MTHEQMERAINFIVEHHAQFAADIQQLSVDIQQLKETQVATERRLQQVIEAQANHEKQLAKLTDTVISVTTLVGRVAKAQEHTEEKLSEVQKRTEEIMVEANARMVETDARLIAQMAETDARLKSFILVVERYISSRNGNGKN